MASNITITRFLNGQIGYKAVIDHIESKVVEQGCKSLNGMTGMCAYRGANGTKCGIGFIIPDSRYKKRFDDDSVSAGPIRNVISYEQNTKSLGIDTAISKLGSVEWTYRVNFLNDIQLAHDKALNNGFVDNFKNKMAIVRFKYINELR